MLSAVDGMSSRNAVMDIGGRLSVADFLSMAILLAHVSSSVYSTRAASGTRALRADGGGDERQIVLRRARC